MKKKQTISLYSLLVENIFAENKTIPGVY